MNLEVRIFEQYKFRRHLYKRLQETFYCMITYQPSEDRKMFIKREAWVLEWSMVLTNLVPRSHSSMLGFLRTRRSPPLLCHSYKRNFPVVKVNIFPSSRNRVSAYGEWSPTEFTKEGGCRFSFSKGGQEK